MTPDHKKIWKCQDCRCKMPKTGNTNTPIRPQTSITSQRITPPSEENNVTIRRKTYPNNDSTTFENLTLLGDTMCSEEGTTPNINTQAELSLHNLSEIIMKRLKENNEAIITDLRSTIQTEINKAITKLVDDFEQKTSFLSKQNELRTQDIEEINTKIENLLKENEKLKQEISEIKSLSTSPVIQCIESNCKKIVIYGLTEYYKEPENDLHNRIIEMFRDILQVDLMGYVENMYRLGKKNTNTRPLVIELISKRMAKYIKNNSHYFQGTGLSISEFLDENSRKKRQQMREEMIKARKEGLHAVIRNNQLYVEGKAFILKDETHKNQPNYIANEKNINLKTFPNTRQRDSTASNEDHNNYSFRKHRPTI